MQGQFVVFEITGKTQNGIENSVFKTLFTCYTDNSICSRDKLLVSQSVLHIM